jgi:cysteine desulfurase
MNQSKAMTNIYFDHNATTPLHPMSKNAMMEIMNICGNASSIHNHGREVRQYIESARLHVATYFNVTPAQVVFTSGATEANNLVIKGFTGQVIVSAIEHDSILKARDDLIICPVTSDGIIDLVALENLLQQASKPCLVSIMAANNETGVLQPLEAIIEICQRYQVLTHTDAVQVIGKCNIHWQQLKFDYISVSAHKMGGPQGIGALIVNPFWSLRPQMTGGGQERYFRSGTENVIGIVGFGAAIQHCQMNDWAPIIQLKNELEDYMITTFPQVTIFGVNVPRTPNTINLTMPGVVNTVQVMHFDLNNVSLSAGSACSSGKVKTSHVLQAMGIDKTEIETSIRLSLGLQTTAAEIQHFIHIWKDLYDRTYGGAENRSIRQ